MDAAAPIPAGARRPRTAGLTAGAVGLVWLLVVGTAVGRWVLLGPVRQLPEFPGPVVPSDIVGPLVAVALASLGALVILRGDPRRYGWLLLATGGVTGVVGFAMEYSVYATFTTSAASMPFATIAAWVQDLWMAGWFLAYLLLPALFPDGTTASPRWRRPVQLAAAGWVVLIVVFMLAERPLTNAYLEVSDAPANPAGVLPVPELAINLAWLLVTVASVVIGVGSLLTRWRGSRPPVRQQLKWVLYAFGLVLAVAAADLGNQALVAGLGIDLGLTVPLAALSALTVVALVVSLGLAVLRFRLYDVDTVINRTIVYGALTVIIVIAYVAVVVGAGALLPVEDLFLSLVATGMVALGFAPLRTRLQQWVNRLMFGQRDDPYAVLSELGRLLARSGAPEAALQTLAETVATALRLPAVTIDLEQDGSWRTRASCGMAADVDSAVVVPLRHQGEIVGRLMVAPRSPREPLSVPDRRLLADIAHQAGALAHAVRLTTALKRSREGLVLAREEERRRIRRDLHDGLGPTLASQTFRFDAVLAHLRAGDPAAASDLVAALKQQSQQLVADIRRLVHELRPPALDELGLAGSLAAHVGQLDRTASPVVALDTAPDPLPDLPAAVEVAAYRITREAITNVIRHAGATRCTIRLSATDSTLSITVVDDGVGLAAGSHPGVGLASMRERAEELGGTFELEAAHPTGTQVRATLPLTTTLAGHTNGAKPAVEEIGVHQ